MIDHTDTRDRVIALETDVKHLSKTVEKLNGKIDDVDAKVDEIKSLLTQAKGGMNLLRFMIYLSGTSVFVGLLTYGKTILIFLAGIK